MIGIITMMESHAYYKQAKQPESSLSGNNEESHNNFVSNSYAINQSGAFHSFNQNGSLDKTKQQQAHDIPSFNKLTIEQQTEMSPYIGLEQQQQVLAKKAYQDQTCQMSKYPLYSNQTYSTTSGAASNIQSNALPGISVPNSTGVASSRIGLSNRRMPSFTHSMQQFSSPPTTNPLSPPTSSSSPYMLTGVPQNYGPTQERGNYPVPSEHIGAFRNPWGSMPIPANTIALSPNQTGTENYSYNLPVDHYGTRNSFSSVLSTTFEDMELNGNSNRKYIPATHQLPPLPRTPNQLQQTIVTAQPSSSNPPITASSSSSNVRGAPRRRSIATGCFSADYSGKLPHLNSYSTSTSPSKDLPLQLSYVVPSAIRRPSLPIHSYSQRLQLTQKRAIPAPRFSRVKSLGDLHPQINIVPKYRRATSRNTYVSPLNALTTSISASYLMCAPEFSYRKSQNPRRVLTKPSEPGGNQGFDNESQDYILYVNDILGTQENKKYLVIDILGYGTFGQVVKCQNLDTHEIVAVKVVKSIPMYFNKLFAEASILEYLNQRVDPNDEHHIMRLKDKFVHKGHICLVLELLSLNLYQLLKQNQFNGLSINLIKEFTAQMLDALCTFKDAELIHGDLKPENVLLVSSDHAEIKVIDFGSACHQKQVSNPYIQSRFYRSPEVILGLAYGPPIDMWSVGCIVAELFLGYPLLPGASSYDQLFRIIRMFGMPAKWMLEMGQHSQLFFNKQVLPGISETHYSFKTLNEYSMENHKAIPKMQGEHFKNQYLYDIIMNYKMPRKYMNKETIDQEMSNRKCLAHFLKGVLEIDPLKRWTPQEACLHPFVTDKPFDGNWSPPSRR